ncbi:MAG: cation:proton antiporter [Rhizobiaceae bacterium]
MIAVAVTLGLGLMRLRQPPLVGFILAGVITGPTGLGLVSAGANVSALAEMGVLLLLFFIGMELSLKAFVHSLRPALLIALGQLAVSLAIGAGVAVLTGAAWAEGVIIGFIVALSSTVVAMKMLDDMGELRKRAGRITVGVLIAQDLALAPMLIFVSAMGGQGVSVFAVTVRIVFAVSLLAWLLWWLGKHNKFNVPFTEAIEGKTEIVALGALAICFGAAALSGLFGLSPAYGAFLAGLVVGNSTLRSRAIPVIEPIQSVLLVVFFLSIGLLIDLNYIVANFWEVTLVSLMVIAAKSALNVFLLRLTGYDRDTALIGGLSMAQIGEFSFILAAAGFASGALGPDSYRLAIAVTAVTLLVSPAWSSLMHRVHDLANTGYASYRAALSEAYAAEIGNVGHGVFRVRLRYRAARKAWRRARRKAKVSA